MSPFVSCFDLARKYTKLNKEKLRMMLKQKMIRIDIQTPIGKNTLFHIALMNENYKIIPFLLIEGASQTIKNKEGLSPMDVIKYIPVGKTRKKLMNAIMKMSTCALDDDDPEKSFNFDEDEESQFLGFGLDHARNMKRKSAFGQAGTMHDALDEDKIAADYC